VRGTSSARSDPYDPGMTSNAFVPTGFRPPTSLVTDRFRLEPLGPQHNAADHAAWTSSVEHIRGTPGYPDGEWPPRDGMPLEANLADLRRHAADFEAGTGFTFTVLDPADGDVIGCVYLYPADTDEHDVAIQSWVRSDRSALDTPLADAVADWVATQWPWRLPDRFGR
jgi:RimJ/RimL family protein N-acetyltransferase